MNLCCLASNWRFARFIHVDLLNKAGGVHAAQVPRDPPFSRPFASPSDGGIELQWFARLNGRHFNTRGCSRIRRNFWRTSTPFVTLSTTLPLILFSRSWISIKGWTVGSWPTFSGLVVTMGTSLYCRRLVCQNTKWRSEELKKNPRSSSQQTHRSCATPPAGPTAYRA